MNDQPVILIPARLASTRLPRKPLADIAGLPMIVHVWHRAMEADCGRVVVAAAETEIVDAVISAGGEAVLTDPDLPSGSDRIHQALELIDADGAHRRIVNLQGDLPTLDPSLIQRVLDVLGDNDMSTLVAEIVEAGERNDPNGSRRLCLCRRPHPAMRCISPGPPRRPATGRFTIISAFMPISARRWQISCRGRLPCWNSANALSNCARWRRGCASVWLAWIQCLSGSIPRKILNLRIEF